TPALPYLHFFLMLPPPPTSTLFPYTTLFRSAFIEDPERLSLKTTVNDQVMQDARTDDLTHNIGDLLAFLSQTMTLLPGDVLSTRSEEHTSELQSRFDLVCRLLLEKKNKTKTF